MPHWYIDWNIQVEHFANKGNTLVELQGLTMVHLRHLFAQISLPFGFGALILMDTHVLHLMPLPPQFALVPSVAAVLFGFFAPKIYLRNAADKRAKQLQRALPDGLDLMVICAEAGLSLDTTLVRVSRELGSTWPELAEEFGITAAELTFLPDRRMA